MYRGLYSITAILPFTEKCIFLFGLRISNWDWEKPLYRILQWRHIRSKVSKDQLKDKFSKERVCAILVILTFNNFHL